MRLSSYATIGATFLTAGALCLIAAGFSVTLIEDTSRDGTKRALEQAGMTWSLIGLVPGSEQSEQMRARIIELAGDGTVSDLLENARYPAPEGWQAFGYLCAAAGDLALYAALFDRRTGRALCGLFCRYPASA